LDERADGGNLLGGEPARRKPLWRLSSSVLRPSRRRLRRIAFSSFGVVHSSAMPRWLSKLVEAPFFGMETILKALPCAGAARCCWATAYGPWVAGREGKCFDFFGFCFECKYYYCTALRSAPVSSAAEGSAVRVLENQTFSKTLFILWDVRLFHAPEVSASTSVTLKFNGSSGDQLAVEFAAFSQQWRLATRLNRFLLPELLPAELRRASDGAILENRLRGTRPNKTNVTVR
uniref:Polyketide_cyc domain-containing protein n=1 Tax=Macrostomum lignano TaxID=282301 RepID=A0A1I8F3D8_9PLAT